MTTIVGVLNKRAVAIAADSAVTVGDTHKVMNTGNKIFALSKFAPVGIAIYGNASMMDTPWEVIIKCYRRQLNQTKFQYLREYVEDFLGYLRNHEFFASPEIQHRHLFIQMNTFFNSCVEQAKARANFLSNPAQAIIDELNDCKVANQSVTELNQDFIDYDYADFKVFAKSEIEAVLNQSKVLNVSTHYDIFAESYYHYLRLLRIDRDGESGLVFVGYGEEEIYPCLYNVICTIGFEHKLQFRYGENYEITNEKTPAVLVPFAQVNTTQTVIRGINPVFFEIITSNFSKALAVFQQQASSLLKTNKLDAIANQIDSFNIAALAQTFTNVTQKEFYNHYTVPLIKTVEHLGISDMANVAESLVSLTSLVQRMSLKEESVGGPVDVAVISKGDGLIWIKRKHYFNPDLNAQFFNNYNND